MVGFWYPLPAVLVYRHLIIKIRADIRVWWENLRERDRLEHIGVRGRVLLKWIF